MGFALAAFFPKDYELARRRLEIEVAVKELRFETSQCSRFDRNACAIRRLTVNGDRYD